MTMKLKHHSHAARVDLERQHVRLEDGETYRWESGDFASCWYRVSKTRCRKNMQEVPFVPEEKRNHKKHEWDDVLRPLDDHKPKDRHLIRTLEREVERAERQKERHEKGTIPRPEDVIAAEHAMHGTAEPDSDAEGEIDQPEEPDSELTPWQKRAKQGPPKKGQRVERTKYGVRVYSCDGKTYWDLCVNNSTKYRGTAVRLTLPPPRKDGKRWNMAVFDLEAMEAIRREFARGERS